MVGRSWLSLIAPTQAQRDQESVIIKRRRFSGLKDLPVGFGFITPNLIDNDLATGSWWFVVGGILSMLIPIVILLDNSIGFFEDENSEEEIVEAAGEVLTWWLLLISGFFVTIGSWCFVRAFSEPVPPPLGEHCLAQSSYCTFFGICLSTDEVLASWLFLAGSLPSLPYAAIFYAREPMRPAYIFGLLAAIASVLCAIVFVWAVIQPVQTANHSTQGEDAIDTTIFTPSGQSISSLSMNSTPTSSIPENEELNSFSTPAIETSDHFTPPMGKQGESTPATTSQTVRERDLTFLFRTVDISSTAASNATSLSLPPRRHHSSQSPLKSKLMMPVVEKVIGKESPILMHVSTDFLLAAWLSLFISIAWALGSLFLLMLKRSQMNSRVDFAYLMSFIDSIPFGIGSLYYISGGFFYSGDDSLTHRLEDELNNEKNPLHTRLVDEDEDEDEDVGKDERENEVIVSID